MEFWTAHRYPHHYQQPDEFLVLEQYKLPHWTSCVSRAVPWYNLQELHAMMLPEIERQNAIVAKSYLAVFFDAMLRGPESLQQNVEFNAERVVVAPLP